MAFLKSVKDGKWTDPHVWSAHRAPQDGDKIEIYHVIRCTPDMPQMKGLTIELKSPTAMLDTRQVKATAITSQMPGPGRISASTPGDD